MRSTPLRAGQPRYQQTRFQQRVAQAGERLERWATNPWRRFSLLLIVLLGAFIVGNGVPSIAGQLGMVDQVWAIACVLLIETAARLRRRLRHQNDGLALQMLDMARMGLLYGLLLDGLKVL